MTFPAITKQRARSTAVWKMQFNFATPKSYHLLWPDTRGGFSKKNQRRGADVLSVQSILQVANFLLSTSGFIRRSVHLNLGLAKQ